MKKMKKLSTLGLSAILAASLIACGGSSQESPDNLTEQSTQNHAIEAGSEALVPYDNCTLTFSWWGDAKANEHTLAAIEAFEAKYPGITINPSFGTWNGWEDTMASQFNSGYTPDINQISLSWLYDYSAKGEVFLDLNTVSDVLNLSEIEQTYLEMCTVADALQAIPVSLTGKIFCWDKTTFDKASINVPTTLDELINAGIAFEEELGNDYYPLALTENDKMVLMVYYLESVYGKAWIENNALNYTTEEIQAGLEFIQSLEDSHVIPSSEELADSDTASLSENKNWKNGKYAGIFCWDYEAAEYESSLKDGKEFIVGNILSLGEYQGGFSKLTMAYAISETCEHPKEAALFIDFLLNQMEGASIIGSDKGIPLSKAALNICTEQGIVNENILAAHHNILDYVTSEMDSKFEDTSLTSVNGLYYNVMAGMSYEMYDSQTAAQILYDGIKTVLDNH